MTTLSHQQCQQGCTAIPDEQPLRCGFCRVAVVIGVPGMPNPHWESVSGASRCLRRPGQSERTAA